MDKLLLFIICILALYAWVSWKVRYVRELQANCHHQWNVMDVPDPSFRPAPLVDMKTNIPTLRVRNCKHCKKQERWNTELNLWD